MLGGVHRNEVPARGAGGASARIAPPARVHVVNVVVGGTCVRSGMRTLASTSHRPPGRDKGKGKSGGVQRRRHTVHLIEPVVGEERRVGGIHNKHREKHLPARSSIRARESGKLPAPRKLQSRQAQSVECCHRQRAWRQQQRIWWRCIASLSPQKHEEKEAGSGDAGRDSNVKGSFPHTTCSQTPSFAGTKLCEQHPLAHQEIARKKPGNP